MLILSINEMGVFGHDLTRIGEPGVRHQRFSAVKGSRPLGEEVNLGGRTISPKLSPSQKGQIIGMQMSATSPASRSRGSPTRMKSEKR